MEAIHSLFGFQLTSGHRSEVFTALTFALNEILLSKKPHLDTLEEKKKAISSLLAAFYKKYPFHIQASIFPLVTLPPCPLETTPVTPVQCTSVLIHMRDKENLVYVYDGRKPGMGKVCDFTFDLPCDKKVIASGDEKFFQEIEIPPVYADSYKYVVTAFWCGKRYTFHFGSPLLCGCAPPIAPPEKEDHSSSSSSSSSSCSSSSEDEEVRPPPPKKTKKKTFCGPRMSKPYVVFTCTEDRMNEVFDVDNDVL